MSIPEYKPRAEYIGAGNLAVYSFDFKITSTSQIVTQMITSAYIPLFRVRGVDSINVLAVTFDPINGGGTVTLSAFAPSGYFLTILLATDLPVQLTEFRNKSDFTLRKLEASLDAQAAVNQRLMYLVNRAIKISDNLKDTDVFDPTIKLNTTDNILEDKRGKTLVIGADNASIDFGPSQEELIESLTDAIEAIVADLLAASGAGLPPGGLQYAGLEKNSGADGDALWSAPVSFHGISARFGNVQWDTDGVLATLTQLINITYTPPSISLSSPQNFLREKGTSVTSVTLNAALTKFSSPIAEVEFYQGATQVGATQSSGGGIPNGGTSTQNYAVPFTDNISFSARVRDVTSGVPGSWVVSNTMTIPFVYPYYFGAGAAGLGAGVAALSKDIINNTNNYSKTLVSAGAQKLYIAYPASYGALTSILDANLFEVISTFTASTVSIVGLDTTSQSYRVYESNNLVIAGSFAFQFKK